MKAGLLGCVFIGNDIHEGGATKSATGEAWSAFSSAHHKKKSVNNQPTPMLLDLKHDCNFVVDLLPIGVCGLIYWDGSRDFSI